MQNDFYQKIASSSAHRDSRDALKNYVFENTKFLEDLISIGFSNTDKNHHKACWILELICEEKIAIFIPFIDLFCNSLHKISDESSLRSLTKICLFLSKNKQIKLSSFQEEKIIECCFDCLIKTEKTANAAYSMRTLYNLSTKYNWIKEELIAILSKDISTKPSGYRFAVKDILKKLNP
jgi:hypothetical protein